MIKTEVPDTSTVTYEQSLDWVTMWQSLLTATGLGWPSLLTCTSSIYSKRAKQSYIFDLGDGTSFLAMWC